MHSKLERPDRADISLSLRGEVCGKLENYIVNKTMELHPI